MSYPLNAFEVAIMGENRINGVGTDLPPALVERPISLPSGNYVLIGWDMITTGQKLIDEICQIAAYTPKQSYSEYIMPYGYLNPGAYHRHNLRIVTIGRYRQLKDISRNRILKTQPEIKALTNFLNWLESCRGEDGVILIYHDPLRLSPMMLLQALMRYNLLDRFKSLVAGFADNYAISHYKTGPTIKSLSLRVLSRVHLNSDKVTVDKALQRASAAYKILQHFSEGNLQENGEVAATGGGEGAVASSDGAVARSDGTVASSNGAVASCDGVVASSDGAVASSDGTVASSDGAVASSDGAVASSDGAVASSDGAVASSNGTVASSNGAVASCDGVIASSDGAVASSNGAVASCDGVIASSDGAVASSDGAVASSDGTVASSDWAVANSDGTAAGNERQSPRMDMVELARKWARPVRTELLALTRMKNMLERQNTFRPVFAPLFRTSRCKRKHFMQLQRLLADSGLLYDQLKDGWQNNQSAGIKELLTPLILSATEEDIKELIEIFDCHFDPTKESKNARPRIPVARPAEVNVSAGSSTVANSS